jgi:hypothetical protein
VLHGARIIDSPQNNAVEYSRGALVLRNVEALLYGPEDWLTCGIMMSDSPAHEASQKDPSFVMTLRSESYELRVLYTPSASKSSIT